MAVVVHSQLQHVPCGVQQVSSHVTGREERRGGERGGGREGGGEGGDRERENITNLAVYILSITCITEESKAWYMYM